MRAFHDGSILAGYRLERPLGRGGMGEVWLARDARLDRPVALKVLVAALSYDPEFRLRFLEETRLAAALDHPHIVPVYEAGEADGELFLAMRYVEGADLDAIIAADGPLDQGRAVGLLRGIADALDAAHARGLIHRDVKPGNILVTRTPAGEHAYLTDFGLTKRLDAGTTLGDKIVGSVGYIAPEQIEGGPIDRRSDVYSLGCVVYAALIGVSPFVRETDAATLYAHLQAEPAPIDTDRPELSALEPVIRRALAKAPEGRQDSTGALMREVATALGVGAAAWTTTAGKADIELPYVGLRAFDEGDARFYFGREDEVASLVEHLRGDRFLAVFGPSGSGKSSLVRAGLIPALRAGGIPGSADWPVCVVRPGARPLEAIAAQLVRLRPDAAMGRTVDDLASDQRTLHLASTLALADAPADRRVVWVVDQAEELFTLCHDDEMRAAAIATLVHAATVADGRTVVVLAMRADFYHRCAAYPDLAAAVARSQFLVTPMDLDGLRRAIIEPARLVGLEFEPGLVDTILEDVAVRPGSLPLLEHALFELWDRRRGATMTLAGYRESGGVDGAIAVRAELIYTGLSDGDQAIARRVLLRLTQLGEGTEDTRRRATYRELGAGQADDDPVDRVVEELVGARLLTLASTEGTGEPIVDIAHEALLRAWPRIKTWVDEDRTDLTVQRWIADAAGQWERLDRDDDGLFRGARLAQASEFLARRPDLLNDAERAFVRTSASSARRQAASNERRRRFALAGAFVVAAFFIGLSLVAGLLWFQAEGARREAVRSLDEATSAKATADAALTEAESQRTEAERQRSAAVSRQLIAQSLLARDDVDLSLLLSMEAIDHGAVADGTRSLLDGLASRPRLSRIFKTTEAVAATALSPDGSLVAGVEGEAHVIIWDVESGERLTTGAALEGIPARSIAFSPDSRNLAIGSEAADVVTVVDLGSGSVRTSDHVGDQPVQSVAWDPNGTRVAWTAPGATPGVVVWTWDLATDALSMREVALEPLPGPFTEPSATISPDAAVVAARWSSDRPLAFYDATDGRELGHVEDVADFAFSSDGSAVVTTSGSGAIRVRSLPDLALVGTEIRIGEGSPAVAVGPDGRAIAAPTSDGFLAVWDTSSGLQSGPALTDSGSSANSIAFAADQPAIAVGLFDRRIELFDLSGRDRFVREELTPITPSSPGTTVSLGPNRTVISNEADRIALAPSRIVTEGEDPAAVSGTIWSVADGRSEATIPFVKPIEALTFAPDGSITFLDVDGHVGTFSNGGIETDPRRFFPEGSPPAVSIGAGPDGLIVAVGQGGTYVATGSGDVRPYPDVAGESVAVLPGGRAFAVTSVPSADNFGNHPAMLRIVGVDDGSVQTSAELGFIPTSADVTADGTVAAVAGFGEADTTIGGLAVVDLATGTVLPISAAGTPLVAVRFEPGAGGKSVLTVDDSGRIQRWDLDPASWRSAACRTSGRNLSRPEWTRYVGDEPYRETCPGLPVPPDP